MVHSCSGICDSGRSNFRVPVSAAIGAPSRNAVPGECGGGDAGGADFADCLIAHRNHARGCTQTCTFDRGAASSRHFSLVP